LAQVLKGCPWTRADTPSADLYIAMAWGDVKAENGNSGEWDNWKSQNNWNDGGKWNNDGGDWKSKGGQGGEWKSGGGSSGSWKSWNSKEEQSDWKEQGGWNGGQKRKGDWSGGGGDKHAKWEGGIKAEPDWNSQQQMPPAQPVQASAATGFGAPMVGQQIPTTPGGGGPSRIPTTPGGAPQMPAQAFQPAVPSTPANMIPRTPSGPVPGTPAMLGAMQAAPQMQMQAFQPSVPSTPANMIPRTPSGAVPGTPGMPGMIGSAIPATPSGRAPGTPGMPGPAVPGTPAAPGTPGGAPFNSMARASNVGGFVSNFRPGSGLSTPVHGHVPRVPQQAQVEYAHKPKLQTWSDGSKMQLRHAPRRQKGTTMRTSAPCTPAAIPSHWAGKTTPVGERERPPPKDEIPDFGQWKKERRREVRVTGMRRAGETPVPVMSSVPATPGLPLLAPTARSTLLPVVKAPDVGANTPAMELTGDATPFMPRMQTETPLPSGEATPRLHHQGDATPFLPVHSDPTAIARGSETPRLLGEITPFLPGATERNTSAKFGDETPNVAAGAEGSGMTPFIGETSGESTPFLPSRSAAGTQPLTGVTPNVSGEETPRISDMASAQRFAAQPGDATPMLVSKEETTGAASSQPQPGFMTPQVAAP